MITKAFLLSACASLAAAWPHASTAAEPFLEKIDLFQAGEGGYARYHIPGLAVTAKGTVLAWCEARKKGSDWDAIDILLRRSTDDGKTWSEPKKIAEVPGPKKKNPFALAIKSVKPEDVTYNNPVLIPGRDGTVHALFCLEYMRCFYLRSVDDGGNWSAPVEITATFEGFRKAYDWKVLATGPDHGIQLQSGRLLVPVWLSTGTGGNAHRPSVTATVFSDDDGTTWRAGEIAVPCTEEWINPNETVAIELADGRVMLNVRNESKAHRRLVTTSRDGATGWSKPTFDDALLEPICMGSIVRLSTEQSAGRNRILFSNPDNLERADGKAEPGKNRDRRNVSIKLSYDEGATWPVSKPVEPGWSAYSDLAVTQAGTILCFYGRGEKSSFAGDRLTVARCNLEWLTDGSDQLAPVPGSAAEDFLPESTRTMLAKTAAELEQCTAALARTPDSVRLYSRRGDCHLFLGHFAEAVADFEKMIALEPAQDAPHWRLGIAYYFAGDFGKAARQFEKYHAYDGGDRENGIWKFLSQARGESLAKARTAMLAYTRFDREPFPALYEMFAGTRTTDDVFREIERKGLNRDERVLFFANYYGGLNEALLGHRERALELTRQAAASAWGQTAEGGPAYMWQVARLHAMRLASGAE